jgi:ABC-type transport system involved in cytochrome c biogenesis permease subunit
MMEIKYTTQGLLIYTAIGLYILAFLAACLRLKRTAHALFFTAFLASAAAFGYRWYSVKHLPLQNLFEVFLFTGLVVYPISLFSQKILKTADSALDMLIAVIVLFPAGFVFDALPRHLPPMLQSPLFCPHVITYMLAYIFMAKAAFQAALQIFSFKNRPQPDTDNAEHKTYLLICAGFPLLTLGLILGSIWGKYAWGNFWNFDPKEMWSLASWLAYVIYFHFRFMYGREKTKINSSIALAGFAVIVIGLLWVNLSKIFMGLHSYAF